MFQGGLAVRAAKCWLAMGLVGVSVAVLSGCVDNTPPPPDAPLPRERAARTTEDTAKPMPHQGGDGESAAGGLPPPPYHDEPLVNQETPEQPAFVEAYNAVGRPRIVVFVNRTLDGEVMSVPDETRNNANGYNRDHPDGYLQPGQYPEVPAGQIDYEAIENILTDWLSAGGKTEIVSPLTARRRLTDAQVRDLQTGQPRVMGDVARELDADVLVHVAARPTRQTQRGLEIRLVAEAVNLGRGGQSIGRSVVDVPPPLDKPRINKFTRFLARGLMDRMTGTWENLPPPRAGESAPRRRDALDDAVNSTVRPPSQPESGPAPPPAPQPGPRIENAPPDASTPTPSAPPPERVDAAAPEDVNK
jgi:hypothetical protein